MIKNLIKKRGLEISELAAEDKLQYLIDLAKECVDLDSKYKINENKIFGCASNLWVVSIPYGERAKYLFDADAFITKGTTKFVVDILNDQKRSEIANLTREDFKPLGIMELLTAQRQNGLGNLITKLIELAKKN